MVCVMWGVCDVVRLWCDVCDVMSVVCEVSYMWYNVWCDVLMYCVMWYV